MMSQWNLTVEAKQISADENVTYLQKRLKQCRQRKHFRKGEPTSLSRAIKERPALVSTYTTGYEANL